MWGDMSEQPRLGVSNLLSSTHRLAEPPRVLSEQPLMPISRPSESSLRVPHLQSIEPSVGSVPWVVRWPSESSLRGDL